MFNQVSEKCFLRCVDNFNSRTLSPYEEKCVENCAQKFVNINHRVMGVYVEVQSALTQKRINEVQEQNSVIALPNKEQLAVTTEPLSTDNPTT